MPDLPSFDELVLRCETLGCHGYEMSCEFEYAKTSDGGKKVKRRGHVAEVSGPDGLTITVKDARTGREALSRAVEGMEHVIRGKATAGREG